MNFTKFSGIHKILEDFINFSEFHDFSGITISMIIYDLKRPGPPPAGFAEASLLSPEVGYFI